jgi:hypothetical protein
MSDGISGDVKTGRVIMRLSAIKLTLLNFVQGIVFRLSSQFVTWFRAKKEANSYHDCVRKAYRP